MLRVLMSATLLLMVLLGNVVPAHAEDGTPTPAPSPTATPLYRVEIPLSSGNTLLVERRITYGEAAVVISALALLLLGLVYMFIRIPRLWR